MYVHRIQDWPKLCWDADKLEVLLASIRNQQGYLLGRMSSLGFSLQEEASLEILTTDVIKSSAIEGELLDHELVRSSVARRLGVDQGGLSSRDRYVEGVVEMMLDATQRYYEPLTKERLFAWHGAMFPTGRSGLREITVAAWRSGTMEVISGPIGKEKVHFEAPTADRLENEMRLFCQWFNEFEHIDPVLKAGVAHFWFVTIHPFDDGNGRIARAIVDMCLARADGVRQRFYSMSASIESDRKNYYRVLESCQKGDLNITLWLDWFLRCLGFAIESADKVLESILYKAAIWKKLEAYSINGRQRKLINFLLADFKGKLTSGKYAKIAKCSQDTALRDIQLLIQYGALEKSTDAGRSTSYYLVGLENSKVKS
jgi:Fic family protein